MKKYAPIAASLICLIFACPAFAGEIIVSAAASLTDVFRQVEWHYDRTRPDGGAAMNFGSSGALLRQMEMGAPVDVFASADEYTMRLAVEKGLVSEDSIITFAKNSLVLIVPSDSKVRMASPEDLAVPDVKRIAVGNPASVPAGRYAKEALTESGVWSNIEDKLIYAEDVRQALDYVRRGEVDAGIVYRTDAIKAGESVSIAAEIETAGPIVYQVAVAATTKDREAARDFVEYLGKGKARDILGRQGFIPAGEAK